MRTLYILILFASSFVFATSCKKEESANIPMSGDYLPMQVQNYWEIEHTEKIVIASIKVIDNKTYFEFIQASDSSYYRSENNKIYCRKLTEPESVKFDLSANVDESWKYQSWNVKMVSKTDTLLVNHTKVPNCYHFFFDIPMMVDEEHSIWLAPGIGFIKMDCGFCPYPYLNLIKAGINNVEITFP
jgi:hypothetical protein